MFRILLVTCFGFLAGLGMQAQGILKGKVTDEKGEAVFGVIAVAVEDQSILAQTDFEGQFQLKFPNDQLYTLNFVLVGYKTSIEKVQLKGGQVLVKDFTLYSANFFSKDLEIKAKAVKANDTYMEKFKINSATTIDFISSEMMKKTGDQNVVNAIARVSGVSSSGGLITVRGIGDRYVKTTLNGSRIPTLDPLTNNIKLDIFPSSLIDNIIITKTASAELPGDWSGAYISVETKDYPDKLTVNVESQFGYNPQVSFKDMVTSERSKTDFLGFDNSYRVRDADDVVSPVIAPSTYQEMVALGLGDYFHQMGVHGWQDGSAQSDVYFRTGLVELGLLSASNMYDPAAYSAARDVYNSQYKPQAYNIINPKGTDYNSGFANNWNIKKMRAPLNFSQNVSIGNEVQFLGKPLGYFIGFRYGTQYRYDPNGTSQRVGDETLGYPVERQDLAQISRETNSWNALFNLAYKLNANNKLAFIFMPNFIGVNDVAQYSGIPFSNAFEEVDVTNNIFYEQRRQMVYQLNSSHFIPSKKIKIDFNSSFTQGKSSAPDFKSTQYAVGLENGQISGYGFSPTFGEGIRRFYRYLNEDFLDSRLSLEMPLKRFEVEGLTRKLLFGVATQRNSRKIDNDEYKLFGNPDISLDPLTSSDLDAYLTPDKFVMGDNFQFYYLRNNFTRNHSFGYCNVTAAYLSSDFEINKSLRAIGGVRVENTDMYVDVDEYYRNGYERDDIRRENVGGFPLVNPGEIQKVNFLPNASLVYKIKTEKVSQANLRFNYSQTLARPSIREMSDAAILDNEFRTLIYGNSELKMVQIQNFDFRGESYFKNGDNVSVSLFYKDFKNHIEMGFGSAGITWENIAQSNVKGLEFEGKKQLGKNFEFRSNVTLVKSEAQFIRRDMTLVDGKKVYTILDTLNRPMFGQAPYLVNSILTYQNDSLGFTATVSYNVQGPRLVIAGAIKGRPDVYEMPRNMIDIKLTKRVSDHWNVGLTIRDILNTAVRRSYNIPTYTINGTENSSGGWYDYDRFRYGTNFNLSISYNL
jgi:hypothetical protein